MQMHGDDELYQVDNVFLGPTGFRFMWRARYQAYGVGAALTAVMVVIEGQLGILGFWPLVYGMLAVVAITRKVMPHITHDHGLRAHVTVFWHEVRAPRRTSTQATVTHMSATGIRRR